MKRCKENCEGWRKALTLHVPTPDWCEAREMSHCPWCGYPLVDEPEMITRTVTYPAPIKSAKDGDLVFMPSPREETLYIGFRFDSSNLSHLTMLSRGWLYSVSDLAIQRAEAMIGEEL